MIQSPIVNSGIAASLSQRFDRTEDIAYFTGITSFHSGDDIRIGDEIMKVVAVGPTAGAANAVKVNRHWMGTTLVGHASHAPINKLSGDFNIINNTLSFSDAPFGGEPPVGYSTATPNNRDWVKHRRPYVWV